jgi:hypothetical protein
MAGDEMDLPKLKELKGEKNLQEWKKLLLLHLSYHDLDQYILEDIAATPANKKDRIKVLLFIQSSLSADVQERLTNGGSKAEEMDPKVLYDDILRIVPAASENAIAELMEEFCKIKRSKYTTFHKFLERVQYLRRRLKELIPTLADEVCVWIALAGIKEYQFYTHLMVQQKEGKLTWEKFTNEMLVEANREGADTSLLAQPSNNNRNPRDQRSEHPLGPRKLHPFCGFRHRGGNELCWKLHPELKIEYDKRMKQEENNKQDQPAPTAPRPSAGSMKFQSGIHGVMVQLTASKSPNKLNKDTLVVDSGASSHTFNDTRWFDSLQLLDKPESFGSANGGEVVTTHRGVARFTITISTGETVEFALGAVYSPNAPCNLISTGELRSDDAIVDGWKDQIVHRKTHQELASLVWISNVAVLDGVVIPQGQLALSQIRMSSVSFDVMHQRLGHANKEAILRVCRQSGITFTTKEVADHHCEACYTSKAQDSIPKATMRKVSNPLEMVRVDVIIHDPGHLGFRYTTHFIDLATGFHWLKFHKEKKDAQKVLKEWVIQIETQTGLKVQNIGIDGGTEFGQGTHQFYNNSIRNWFQSRGTIFNVTTPHTPLYNGASERAGKSITSYARTSLVASELGTELWPFAEETAVKVLNLLPSRTDPTGAWRSPWERWASAIGLPDADQKPYIKHLRIYGCTAYAFIKKENREKGKFTPRARRGQLVGYDDDFGRIFWIYCHDRGEVLRASAARFREDIPSALPSVHEQPEYEVVFDDPGLLDEYSQELQASQEAP